MPKRAAKVGTSPRGRGSRPSANKVSQARAPSTSSTRATVLEDEGSAGNGHADSANNSGGAGGDMAQHDPRPTPATSPPLMISQANEDAVLLPLQPVDPGTAHNTRAALTHAHGFDTSAKTAHDDEEEEDEDPEDLQRAHEMAYVFYRRACMRVHAAGFCHHTAAALCVD